MAKRSVHFTNAWHGTSGGIRTFYEALLAGAEQHRRHLALVVPGPKTSCQRLGEFARIYSIRAPHSPVFDRRYRVLLPHRYVGASRSAVWRLLARERPDVVETCDKYALPFLNGLVKRRAGDGPRPTLIGLSCERMDDNIRAWLGYGRIADAATRAYLRRVNSEHESIFDAIRNQDSDAARAAMRTHLANSRERRRRAAAGAEL